MWYLKNGNKYWKGFSRTSSLSIPKYDIDKKDAFKYESKLDARKDVKYIPSKCGIFDAVEEN